MNNNKGEIYSNGQQMIPLPAFIIMQGENENSGNLAGRSLFTEGPRLQGLNEAYILIRWLLVLGISFW